MYFLQSRMSEIIDFLKITIRIVANLCNLRFLQIGLCARLWLIYKLDFAKN